MRDDPRVYLDGRALGAIGCGFGHQGPATVLSQLRQIAHALRAWNVPLGVAINTAAVKFEAESCSDDAIARQIRIMAAQVVEHARRTNAEK
jgi:FMN reductase